MASNVVELIVKVVDSATAPLRDITSSLDKMSRQLLGIGFKEAAGIGGIALALHKVYEESTQAELSAVRFNAAFDAMGAHIGIAREELDKFAISSQNVTRFSDEQVRDAQTILLRFADVQGVVFTRAQKLTLDLAEAMGSDAAGAAQLLGRALENPIQSMRLLRQVGVYLSETQKEQIQNFIESGHQMEAQKIVLDELAKRYDGLAEKIGNTTAGKVTELKNAFGELFEQQDKFDPLNVSIDELSKLLRDPQLKTAVSETFGLLFSLLGRILDVIKEVVFEFNELRSILPDIKLTGKGGVIDDVKTEGKSILRSTLSPFGNKLLDKAVGFFEDKPALTKPPIDPAVLKKAQKELDDYTRHTIGDLDQISNTIDGVAKSFSGSAIAKAKEFIGAANNALSAGNLKAVNANVEAASQQLQGILVTLKNSEASIKAQVSQAGKFLTGKELDPIVAALKEADQQLAQGKVAEFAVNIDKAQRALADLYDTTAKSSLTDFAKQWDEINAAILRVNFLEASGQISSYTAEVERAAIANSGLARAAEAAEAAIASEVNAATSSNIDQQMAQSTKELEKAFKGVGTYSKAQLQAIGNIQNAFVDMFHHVDEGIGGMLSAFLDALKEMVIQAGAARLTDYLFGSVDEKSGQRGGGGFNLATAILSFASIFAGGGDAPGGLKIVGENGPELMSSGPGRIWNNQQLMAAMGSGGGGNGGITFAPATTINVQGSMDSVTEGRIYQYIEATRTKDQREMTRLLQRNGMRNIR